MKEKSKVPSVADQIKAAKRAMTDYIKLKNSKAKIAAKQKIAADYLQAFAIANRGKFDDNDNYKLPGGYLHFGEETVIVPCEGFSMASFVTDFPELVDKKFKTAAMKALLESEEGKTKLLQNHCVELKKADTFDIVIK